MEFKPGDIRIKGIKTRYYRTGGGTQRPPGQIRGVYQGGGGLLKRSSCLNLPLTLSL
jgi:hypothetical protein